MRKVWNFLRREEILPVMGVALLLTALLTSGVVVVAPDLMSPDELRALAIADPDGVKSWIFIAKYSLIMPLVIGVVVALFRLRWPSRIIS